MASAAGARGPNGRQDSSGDNDFSDAPDVQYGTAVFRTTDLNISDSALHKHYVWQRLEYIFSDFSDVGHLFIDEVLYDEDLADNDRIAVLQAQVARLQTDQREQRLAIQGAFLQDPYVDSDD